MIDIDEAYRALSDCFGKLPKYEKAQFVAVGQSLGSVLAESVSCRLDSPCFDQSAMDGFAFRFQPGMDRFRCSGTVAAGDPPGTMEPGPDECVRIMTGAPVPASSDTVQMIEKTQIDGDFVKLLEIPQRGTHIRFAGENMRKGERLFPEGQVVSPGVLAGLLSQGIRFVKVRTALRVGIAATGNEVVDYRNPLKPGQIYNTNGLSIAAVLARPGLVPIHLSAVADNPEETRAFLAHNTDLDVLILSGGVSMGRYDLVPECAQKAGFRQIFHKIKMKPGKPIWFGAHPKGTLLFGLPGNPVSALVGTYLFVRPMVEAILTHRFEPPIWFNAEMAGPLVNKGGFPFFFGARLVRGNPLKVLPIQTAGSGDIQRFGGFQALARCPPETALKAGDSVQVLLPFHM